MANPTGGTPATRGALFVHPGPDDEAPGPMVRLIRIVRENESLLGVLADQTAKLAHAIEYAEKPTANPSLAAAILRHRRAAFDRTLEKIRRNRAEALAILLADDDEGGNHAA